MPSDRNWSIVGTEASQPAELAALADHSDESMLPADLQAVAEQLTDDAGHLAKKYPANAGWSLPETVYGPSRWLRAAVSVLLLVAGSAGTLLTLRWSGQTEIATGAHSTNSRP